MIIGIWRSTGFRAIVAKCHYHDTVTDILAMAPLLAGLNVEVFGGIALNSQNGGLNPFAVDRSLKMGGKVGNALPVEAYRQVVGNLLDSGVSERDIGLMIRDNPARLIGLD